MPLHVHMDLKSPRLSLSLHLNYKLRNQIIVSNQNKQSEVTFASGKLRLAFFTYLRHFMNSTITGIIVNVIS